VLSYLPLAHIFERAWIEAVPGRRRTCHVFFAEALDTFVADLQRARPTLFISVPRLWLKFQQGVLAKMPAKKLDFLLGLPILGKMVGQEGAGRPGAGPGAAGRQRLGADAAGPDRAGTAAWA
jgi:long-chain acyl-CoA synthetase